jgi:integrase
MVMQRGDVWYCKRWVIDQSGKRVQKMIRLPDAKNEREAKRAEAKIITDMAQGTHIDPSKETISGFLQEWLVGVKPTVRSRTWEFYNRILSDYWIPRIGGRPLSKLTAADIRTTLAGLLENGRKDGKGGISRQSAVHCLAVLKRALKQAVIDGKLLKNPAEFVTAAHPDAVRPEIKVLDTDQTRRLLESVKGTPMFLPVLIGVTTGMRRGEILGLQWEDIDFQAGKLTVRQSAQQVLVDGERGKGYQIKFEPPKTKQSRRTISLPSFVLRELRKHQQEQGRVFGLVNTNPDGQPIPPRAFSQRFETVVRRAGVPHIRFHDLRHGHASQLLKEGVAAKLVSSRLGHSKVGITLDIYTHLMPGMDEEVAERIDAVYKVVGE